MGDFVSNKILLIKTMIELDGTPTNPILEQRFGSFHWLLQKLQNEFKHAISLRWWCVSGNTLPLPMMNIINGGSHSDAPIAFQEFK
jgi:enolase